MTTAKLVCSSIPPPIQSRYCEVNDMFGHMVIGFFFQATFECPFCNKALVSSSICIIDSSVIFLIGGLIVYFVQPEFPRA